jgi:hypothetical protein
MKIEANNSETHPDDFLPAWPAKILRARDNAKDAPSPEGSRPGTARTRAEGVSAEAEQARRSGRGRSGTEERVLRREELDRLSALGIHPEGLAGRLRLVLTIGCYRDFRFTRDILRTGAAREQVDLAIQALKELGASCDCQVLQAVGQPPRGLLWHHPDHPDPDPATAG